MCFPLFVVAPLVGAWHGATMNRIVGPHSCVRMALPAGWAPAVGLPQGVSRQEGFLGSAADRAEAEAALNVKVLDDDSLWEQNQFSQYVSDNEWEMTHFERVVLLFLYLKLKTSKVFANWAGGGAPGQYYEEYIEAARTLGVRGPTILVRHVLPNAARPTGSCRSRGTSRRSSSHRARRPRQRDGRAEHRDPGRRTPPPTPCRRPVLRG